MLYEELCALEIVPSFSVAQYDRSFPITIPKTNKLCGWLFILCSIYVKKAFLFDVPVPREGRGNRRTQRFRQIKL